MLSFVHRSAFCKGVKDKQENFNANTGMLFAETPPATDSKYKQDGFWRGEGAGVVLQSHAQKFNDFHLQTMFVFL